MILIDNINYLREKYPGIREKLFAVEAAGDKQFQVETTKTGDQTLLFNKEGRKTYFHSKYNPTREAQTILEAYQGVKGKNIIFYGTGLGYHIDLFIKENPDNNFYIFEPVGELLEKFLSVRNLDKSEYKNLKGVTLGFENIEKDIYRFLDLNRRETVIIDLPIHKQLFEEEAKRFKDIFLNTVKAKRSQLATDYSFQVRWITNSMKNFKEVLSTPNILMEKRGAFKNVPAILVAAGPSLNQEIDNLRDIKKNKLAYIFSVGSAINTLLYHNVFPDVATTYDPTVNNQKVFAKLKERAIKTIPLVFGSSVAPEVLENYPGKMYHMITSQDKIAHYYLEIGANTGIDVVSDAPTIAVVTLQLLANLGFNPIILVGQNLAYVGEKQHSEGVHYSKDLTEADLDGALWVEDVEGNQTRTNDGFNRMRFQMELYISKMETGRVLNTTKGGAKIVGTEFVALKDLIDNQLTKTTVVDNWLDGNKTNYDKNLLGDKVRAMDKALADSYGWMKEYNANLFKMFDLLKNGNFKQLDRMYNKLDISIKALERNDFFTTFVLQINRVQHKLLSDSVKIFKEEKELYKKHLDLLNAYKGFIDKCGQDIEFLKPIYEEMKQEISLPED
ncbi:MAG: 6-hydroxymethylpterin diphosphokinase MptE-like protein [Bacillota bacterium]